MEVTWYAVDTQDKTIHSYIPCYRTFQHVRNRNSHKKEIRRKRRRTVKA